MGSSYGNKSIVLDNLRFNVDPANKQSYPGSGTTVYNTIKNSSNSGTVSGASFEPTNAGYYIYDGDDYISFNDGPNIATGTNSITTDVWIKNPTELGTTFKSIFSYQNNSGNSIFQLTQTTTERQLQYQYLNNVGSTNTLNLNGALETDAWQNYTIVHEKDELGTNIYAYRNGTLYASQIGFENALSITNVEKFYLGSKTGESNFYVGGISCMKVYNRDLTAEEVKQNYEALRPRFE